jgi:hypothetical protein
MRPHGPFGHSIWKRLRSSVTITAFALSAAVDSAAPETFCRPHLELNPFRSIPGVFLHERVWKAELTGNASQCREESGLFQLQITRWKESAPDLDFLVTEVWQAGRFDVELTMAVDEAIGAAQVMWISRCSCTPRAVVSGQK